MSRFLNRQLENGFIGYFFSIVIFAYVIFYSIETIPQVKKYHYILIWINLLFNVAFLMEYIFRLIASEKKFKYIFSFWGIVDLIAIFPSYIYPSVFNVKIVRLLRIFRLLKILKNQKFYMSIIKILSAFTKAKYELGVFLALSIVFVYLSAIGIYFFENDAQPDKFSSVPASFWWAMITLTTIGYGDVYPITVGGKIFTILITYIGLGFVAVPTSIITFHIAEAYKNTKNRNKKR